MNHYPQERKPHFETRKMALDDMATELLTDAFMWLGEWKETGRCHIDPYNIGRLIETSELCYKKLEAPIPRELGMMKKELGKMKRAYDKYGFQSEIRPDRTAGHFM